MCHRTPCTNMNDIGFNRPTLTDEIEYSLYMPTQLKTTNQPKEKSHVWVYHVCIGP